MNLVDPTGHMADQFGAEGAVGVYKSIVPDATVSSANHDSYPDYSFWSTLSPDVQKDLINTLGGISYVSTYIDDEIQGLVAFGQCLNISGMLFASNVSGLLNDEIMGAYNDTQAGNFLKQPSYFSQGMRDDIFELSPKTWRSTDPPLANELEIYLPNRITSINKTLYNFAGIRSGEIDIEIDNRIAIEFKSGKGSKLLKQMEFLKNNGYHPIGYGENLPTGLLRASRLKGFDVSNNFQALLNFINGKN